MKKFLSFLLLCAFTFVQTSLAATLGDITPGSPSTSGVSMTMTGQFSGQNITSNMGASVFDAANGYLYYGGSGGIVKVKKDKLSSAAFLPTPGISNYTQAEIDTVHGYAYFLSQISPINLVKVQLSNFTIAGTFVIPDNTVFRSTFVIDSNDQVAVIGTYNGTSKLQKIDLTSMTMIQEVSPPEPGFSDAAYDGI